ncbi:DUF2269 family protein [Planctomicrobium sp. SH664]|uniref:DUF2269 family protein n=1 Tax=Planctomicrobium sp. SH664 TaxID=3448125 RepID=UPI003F5B676F
MSVDPVVVSSRVIHIVAAIVLFGGAVFTRFLLMPAAGQLDEEQHQKLRAGVTGRWKYFVHLGITLLIVTGFYNYLVVMRPLHKGDSFYHMWMGIKILLAMVVFFYASALVGRARAFEGIRKNAGFWLLVSIVLSFFVVGIASVLKVRGVPPQATPAAVIVEEVEIAK